MVELGLITENKIKRNAMLFNIWLPFFIAFVLVSVYAVNGAIAERKMTMIIISKDKTKCAEYNRITVSKAYGGKGKKYAVIGSVNHHDDILDCFPDKESAVAELERIFAAYQNGEKTYTL